MKRLLLPLVVFALVAPGGALAGGWATAGLSPPDGGVGAGDTWNAKVTILQHGITPLAGVSPTVTIRNKATGAAETFAAKATDEPGVYLAKVVFPSQGTWTYEVHDGFTHYGGQKTHTFGAVSIGAGGGDGMPFFAIVGLGLLGAAAIAVIYLLSRRVRVRAPAPSH
ncbi:MAG TPA: FixH family protein [Gaiellaceae bacterium]|nr:FixH family protein [Gaiellaceae bacterium]